MKKPKQQSLAGVRKYFLLIALFFISAGFFAQPVITTAVPSNAAPVANEELTVRLDITPEIDFYFASIEINYPVDKLEFVKAEPAGLSTGGLNIAGEISSGKVGISVSRTEPLTAPAQGSFMLITFQVTKLASPGTAELVFSTPTVYNSVGDTLDTAPVENLTLNIAESIGDVKLINPVQDTISEGILYYATAGIFAEGIEDDTRISVWIGCNNTTDTPAAWDESVWVPMETGELDASGYRLYTAEIARKRPVGNWYAAVRAQLDDGTFMYGGTDGLWSATDNPNGLLVIEPQPSYRYIVAAWNFDTESLLPSQSVPANDKASMKIEGASLQGFSSGASGMAVNSNNWAEGGDGSKYWYTKVSTKGFTNLELSSKQNGSGTGPRDFNIALSNDGSNWQDMENSDITVGSNWTSGVSNKLLLPPAFENLDSTFISWKMRSDTSIGGGEISSSGTDRLDDVLLTGINPSPQRVSVFPGDANNDGIVNADDVLPLGTYWLSSGPTPPWNSLEFTARETEEWIPSAATYADADGNGKVDHRDLYPIGLHFGKTISPLQKKVQNTVAEIMVKPQPEGTVLNLLIESNTSIDLRGMTFNISIEGIPEDCWKMNRFSAVPWLDKPDNDMLSLIRMLNGTIEAGFTLRGRSATTEARQLAVVEIEVTSDWPCQANICLNRLTISNNSLFPSPLNAISLYVTGTVSADEPYRSQGKTWTLEQNYPNPFEGTTTIRYELPVKDHVLLSVYNIQGRKVATLVKEMQAAGSHNVRFDAAGLPPGLYLCKMETGKGFSKTMKMNLMKK